MSPRPLILVVDDDLPILILMKSLLREFGFDSITAGSGQEAIEQARAHNPSLILLDRNMPGMSGDEVLDRLRTNGTTDVPVLLLSGEPIPPDEVQRLGATAAVLKPFDVPDLVKIIRAHVPSA
jgi:CheY-like chemotaxis protein